GRNDARDLLLHDRRCAAVRDAGARVRADGGVDPALTQSSSLRRSPFLRPENMVHQTISTSSASAPRASSRISHMLSKFHRIGIVPAAILGLLVVACSTAPVQPPPPAASDKPPAPISPIEAAGRPRPPPNGFAALFRPRAR